MKPQLLQVSSKPGCSFIVTKNEKIHDHNVWHYHRDIELIYIKHGHGTQFVGDNISKFAQGDIVLIGPRLPHYFRFDDSYFKDDRPGKIDAIMVHFSEDFCGADFLRLPENTPLKNMLEKAKRGLHTEGSARPGIQQLMEKMTDCDGPEKMILFLKVLMLMSNCATQRPLSSIVFKYYYKQCENDRINAIYEYSVANFKNKIQLEEIAAVANICPNSFCRYFKSQTKKTYSQFLIEIKIGVACKLLIENKISIKQLCSECGFNSFSSLHKFFKRVTGKSPLIYKTEFISLPRSSYAVKELLPFEK